MEPNNDKGNSTVESGNGKFQQRQIIAFMCFISIAVAYISRVIIGVALTVMTNKKHMKSILYSPFSFHNETNTSYHLKFSPQYNEKTEEFDWNEIQQGNILSSFFFGYIVSHLPGGILSEKFGGKIVVFTSLVVTAITSTITPSLALYGGYIALCFCRVILGLAQGVLYPSLGYFIGRWIPIKERARYGSFIYGGCEFGGLVGNLVSGYLIANSNWRWAFYMAGILAILWGVCFLILSANDPLSHPRITKTERDYLIAELGDHVKKGTPHKSWKHLLKNKRCLSYFFCEICYEWGFNVIAINLPKYMSDVMNVSVKKNGIINAVAYLLMWIVSFLAGSMADHLYINKILNLTNVRKYCTILASMMPAIFMVFAVYSTELGSMVFFFTTAVAFMGFQYGGIKLTPLDLSPNFAPSIMAIGNSLGAISGLVAPNIIGIMTPDATQQQWQGVFLLTLLIRFIGTVVYIIFTTAEIQPWDNEIEVKEKEKTKESLN